MAAVLGRHVSADVASAHGTSRRCKHRLLLVEQRRVPGAGQPARARPQLVGVLGTTLSIKPLLVLLNSCDSAAQAANLVDIVPFAIGLSDTINDIDAITYAARFYAAVADGQSVRAAHELSQAAVEMNGLLDHDLPTLACAENVDPGTTKLVTPPSEGTPLTEPQDQPRLQIIDTPPPHPLPDQRPSHRTGPVREESRTGPATKSVVVKGGRLRGERLHEASAERSSSWAIGEARGHCPLHNHALHNRDRLAIIPTPHTATARRSTASRQPVCRHAFQSGGHRADWRGAGRQQ
ncbi:hypothetical protein ABZT23_40645 [Streptomyces sp. NPDC005386]|uniref:hypothetical protein n=1 Tax=Streptomyces sp. NPDC005386 TaxID=3154562 RepID=UPI0033BF99C4